MNFDSVCMYVGIQIVSMSEILYRGLENIPEILKFKFIT